MKNTFTQQQLRQFGLLIGIGFPIIIGWILPSLGGHVFRMWTLSLGIPFLILAMIQPFLLINPYKWWMALGHALGWINSHIILGLVFLVVLQPIAFFMRLSGYNPLRKNLIDQNSYRENKKNHPIDLTRIF